MKLKDNYSLMSFHELEEELENLKSEPENLEKFKKITKEFDKRKKTRNEEELKRDLSDCYRYIKSVWKEYMDMKDHYYPLVVCWTIGTYLHDKMITYPFLYFNAGKGSGKTRAGKLLAFFSKNGEVNNNMTEAVLFRTKGTLVIDEFEGVGRKGIENFRELCNSAYKKGSKVRRMKKKSTPEGEEQVVEEFSVFRPLVMCNIIGMEDVLGDRCLPFYLEKTTLKKIGNLMEIFDIDPKNQEIKEKIEKLVQLCSFVYRPKSKLHSFSDPEKPKFEGLCSYVVSFGEMYTLWNNHVQKGTLLYNTSDTYNYTKLHTLFNKIDNLNADGRMLELSFPLLLIADLMSEEIFEEVFESLKIILKEKKEEEFIENKDVYFIDFVSQGNPHRDFTTVRMLAEEFKIFLQSNEEWINSKWLGRAIRRLSLFKKKKRTSKGIEVILDVEKAQEKIKMFK